MQMTRAGFESCEGRLHHRPGQERLIGHLLRPDVVFSHPLEGTFGGRNDLAGR
jgi:hypothetical protein